MKRKPSKRTINNRMKREWLHQARNGWNNIVTLGDCDLNATFYYNVPNTLAYSFPEGTVITVDSVFGQLGTEVRHGKNPKKVHPARRNKEKKKIRTEAKFSSGGATVTMYRDSGDTWIIAGTDVT